MQGIQVDVLKADVGQGGHRELEGLGPWGQRCRMRFNRVGRQILRLDFLEPSVFVGGEDGVGLAGQGEDLLAFKNHMVFVGMKGNPCVGQCSAHLGVSGQGGRFIVVAGKNRL